MYMVRYATSNRGSVRQCRWLTVTITHQPVWQGPQIQ